MLKRLFNRKPKRYTVHVEPFGTEIVLEPKETILQGALKAGLAYPYECQNGACTTCKTQLLAGEIKALSDFSYVLDLDEMERGTILACRALAKSDLKLKVDTLSDGLPTIAPRTLKGTVKAIESINVDIIKVAIQLDEPMHYYAGQYANLAVPGVALPRSYSFASAPHATGNDQLLFHIRVLPDGEVSNWLGAGNRCGSEVTLEGPFGIFRMRAAASPIVCIAGGSGMAPIKAMIENVENHSRDRALVLLYGARTQADLYPQTIIENLQASWPGEFHFIPVLSEEPSDSDWSGERGFVTDAIEKIDLIELPGAQAYLCGPPPMIDAAIPVLTHAGVRGRDIFFDKFSDRSSSN